MARSWGVGLTGALLLVALSGPTFAPLAHGSSAGPCGTDGRPALERRVHVMGTFLSVRAWGERDRAASAVERAVREVERTDALLSTWRPGTWLDRLNRAPAGQPVHLPRGLFDLLVDVEDWSRSTGGAFDPAVGPLVDAWGLRSGGRTPSTDELEAALEAVRAGVTLDAAAGTGTRQHPRSWLDSGGFGKGAALRRASISLRRAGLCGVVLDFGGQFLVLGAPRPVHVAHPVQRDVPVASLTVSDASVATSGPSERPGHLLDPRTGRPVAWQGSVTVVAEDPLTADVLSTGLHVLGPEEGMRWAEGGTDAGVLFLEATADGLRTRWNDAMRQWMDESPLAGLPSQDTDPDQPNERNQP